MTSECDTDFEEIRMDGLKRGIDPESFTPQDKELNKALKSGDL